VPLRPLNAPWDDKCGHEGSCVDDFGLWGRQMRTPTPDGAKVNRNSRNLPRTKQNLRESNGPVAQMKL